MLNWTNFWLEMLSLLISMSCLASFYSPRHVKILKIFSVVCRLSNITKIVMK